MYLCGYSHRMKSWIEQSLFRCLRGAWTLGTLGTAAFTLILKFKQNINLLLDWGLEELSPLEETVICLYPDSF